MRRWLATAAQLWVTVSLLSCGTRALDHAVAVQLVSPEAACGPPPWQVLAFPPHRDYSGSTEWALERTAGTSPSHPYAVELPSTDTAWAWDSAPPASVSVGLFIPCLRRDGWWRLEAVPEKGATVPATAHFVPWGSLIPASDAATLPLSVTASQRSQAWYLDIRVPSHAFNGAS